MTAPIQRSVVHTGHVVGLRQLTPRMRRVTVRAEAMNGVQIRPAQDVELHLRDESGRRVKRRYTIRAARPDDGELDLDVVLHGDGPGARWAAGAVAGDEVSFQGPRGKLELHPADWHLLAGDESALPAIAAICDALPDGEAALAVVEVHDRAEQLPVAAESVHWVYRGEREPGAPDQLLAAVAGLRLPAGAGRGYLMGETRSMVALRAELESRGMAHDSLFVKGYWNIGRPDRIAGRRPRED